MLCILTIPLQNMAAKAASTADPFCWSMSLKMDLVVLQNNLKFIVVQYDYLCICYKKYENLRGPALVN